MNKPHLNPNVDESAEQLAISITPSATPNVGLLSLVDLSGNDGWVVDNVVMEEDDNEVRLA